MKKLYFSCLIILGLLAMGCAGNHESLLLLGNVITIDEAMPSAEAVYVEDGIIKFVGSQEEARKMCRENTVVKDYGSASIYPGFMDGHTHGALAASRFNQADLAEINGEPNSVMADFVVAMKQYMEENPGLPIYKGSGWTVKDQIPCAAMLDEICPDVPMLLNSEDGHSMWVNTAAMKEFHIDADAVRKYGTDCVRVDSEGRPTGYLSENPCIELLALTGMNMEECKEGLIKWQRKAFSVGITATTEAALTLPCKYSAPAYQALCDEGLWKLRTYAVETIDENVPDSKVDSALNNLLALSKKYNGEYFRVTGVKIFMDGVIEAHTGWLDEEYADEPGYFGLIRCSDASRIAKIVGFCNSHGMNSHFHAIGDAASRVATEGIAQAIAQTGIKDGRNALSHLQIVNPEVIEKMAQNDIIAVVAPLWIPKFPMYDFEYTRKVVGEQRANDQYPVKSFYDAGCKVSFHSDFPVSTSFSIPLTIYAAVTRSHLEADYDTTLNPSEDITREQALRALTMDTAYLWKEEDRMGSVTPGKIANFTVFDTDFLHDDLDKIWNAKLLATYVDGEVVYAVSNK